MHINDAEIVSVSEASVTIAFAVESDGQPSDAPAVVSIDGDPRAHSAGVDGLRLIEIDGLEPNTEYEIAIEVQDAAAPARDPFFPERFHTMAAPSASALAFIGTLNDLHFGEKRLGPAKGSEPPIEASATAIPYWQFMNDDAIADLNATELDAVVIKGDITDTGLLWEFEAAAAAFAKIESPWHAFLGNHDHYALRGGGEKVDGCALLGQPPTPRVVAVPGWHLVMLDSVAPGDHRGRLEATDIEWLDDTLSAAAAQHMPVLLLMHHQPVPPEFASGMINAIGIPPDDSVRLFECVGRHPCVKGVVVGHTHRNRVRRYPQARNIPFAEVCCTKDYPGGWAHYRLLEDGTFIQEFRRISSRRALAHSQRCGRMANGRYRRFALGSLSDRCYSSADRA